MTGASFSLLVSAAAIAIIHTALGPDHWLPFTMLAKARGWNRARTLRVTFWSGLGHVASSLALAIVGLALGFEASRVAGLELARGDVAAWGLVAFGGAYGLWGVRKALRSRHGLVPHMHDGDMHLHVHGDVVHRHGVMTRAPSQARFWTLFAIFVLGPCEPLIPLFILPASRGAWALAGWTALVFSIVTIAAMLGLVAFAAAGVSRIPFGPLERWSHALAGGVIAACGAGVLLLSL
jgi:hypothetical protein